MTGTKPRRRRWIAGALILSMALNLLVAGILLGALWARDSGQQAHPAMRDPALYRMAVMLPRDRRGDLRRNWRRDPVRGEIAAALRDVRADFDAALRGPAPDPAQLAALMAEERALRMRLAARIEAALAQEIAGLSEDERARYADRLQRFGGHRKRKMPSD